MAGEAASAACGDWITPSEEVEAALRDGQPVVALESTVISHGLPAPHNLEVAVAMEAEVRAAGAVPATMGILDGKALAGLSLAQLERFADASASDVIEKASARDIALILARGASGATTVAGTLAMADACRIPLLATGGIGGVHRGYEQTADVSADLSALARFPVGVVASGAKCILDLPRTVEQLESHGVAVVGYQTLEFPAFYHADSGLPVPHRVDDERAAWAIVAAARRLRLGGVLIANPVPPRHALPRGEVESWLEAAEAAMSRARVGGKAATPFLLRAIADRSEGRSLTTNKSLLVANAALAGRIASAARQGV